MARPPFIGLTGGIGAGKSEALAALSRLGAATLSSDQAVHELLDSDELRDRLAERWGDEVTSNGRLDRGKIAELVFERPEELRWLELELHPRVAKRIAEWREGLPADTELAVVEVPLLFETGMGSLFDAVVCVVAEDDVRKRRAVERGLGELEARGERQLDQAEKAARATHVVTNDGSLEELEAKLAELLPELSRSSGDRE